MSAKKEERVRNFGRRNNFETSCRIVIDRRQRSLQALNKRHVTYDIGQRE